MSVESKPSAIIVEDNIDTAEIFTTAVESAGYNTTTVHDGQDALTLLETDTPRLVVLDLHLPSVPGDQILDYIIEEKDRLGDVRVIIASADGMLATFQGYKDRKVYIMQKPVSYNQLETLSRRLLP